MRISTCCKTRFASWFFRGGMRRFLHQNLYPARRGFSTRDNTNFAMNSACRNAKKVSVPSPREKSSRDGGLPPVKVI